MRRRTSSRPALPKSRSSLANHRRHKRVATLPRARLVIGLAGLRIGLSYRDRWIARQCRDYLAEDGPTDFDVSVDAAQIALERAAVGGQASEGSLESSCLYRAIGRRLPAYDRMVIHGAAVALGQDAYLFIGPSGAGKTTQALNWQAALGAAFINGDKPLLRLVDDVFVIYGSPWGGKEGLHSNRSATLRAVFLVEQAESDSAQRLTPGRERAEIILRQLLIPDGAALAARTLAMADALLRGVPLFRLRCTPAQNAAHVALRAVQEEAVP